AQTTSACPVRNGDDPRSDHGTVDALYPVASLQRARASFWRAVGAHSGNFRKSADRSPAQAGGERPCPSRLSADGSADGFLFADGARAGAAYGPAGSE